MSGENSRLGEGLAANFAFIRTLPCVPSHVDFHGFFLGESEISSLINVPKNRH
jgi:hypothetical protein